MNFENLNLMDRTANAAAYVLLLAGVLLGAVMFLTTSF